MVRPPESISRTPVQLIVDSLQIARRQQAIRIKHNQIMPLGTLCTVIARLTRT